MRNSSFAAGNWRCFRHTNIAGSCVGPCPLQLQIQPCRARCTETTGCRSVVTNKYGECYLKHGSDRVPGELSTHETVSCIRRSMPFWPRRPATNMYSPLHRTPKDLLPGKRPYRSECMEPAHARGGTCWDCLTGLLGSCDACAVDGFDCRCSCPVPPQKFGGYVISGDRANASRANPRRFASAMRLCATLGIECVRIPAVFLTTNGKGRCGQAGDALRGEKRGTVGLHLAQQDAWARVAAGDVPAFVFEDDAVLPENLPRDRARALLLGLTSRDTLPDLLKLGHWQHVCNHA